MLNKPVVLTLAVTALFTAAAWSMGAIDLDAACAYRTDSPKEKPQLHGDLSRGRALNVQGDGSDGSTLELRFAYDMLDESRMH
jgi:hypothetical protein